MVALHCRRGDFVISLRRSGSHQEPDHIACHPFAGEAHWHGFLGFDDSIYTTIFPNADPWYYLCRYWLMRVVGSAAKGYPERAYAKWVVLHFLWSRLAPLLRNKAATQALRQICERHEKGFEELQRAANACFRGVILFYRANRGSGARALDVSRFFQRKNLHRRFDSFWAGSRTMHRGAYRKAWTRFEKALKDISA